MAQPTLQGSALDIQLRESGVGSYKTLVCLTDANLTNTSPTSITYTNCGALLSIGTAPSFSVKINAVFDTLADPTTEVTSSDILNWIKFATPLDFLVENPSTGSGIGAVYYRQGTCYASDLGETWSTNEFNKFSFTLSGTGSMETTA